MLKANEKKSAENTQKIQSVIEKATGRADYKVVYGYQEKNLLIITLTSHYAVGYKDGEVVAVQIEKDGTSAGELMKFSGAGAVKNTIYGKTALTNADKKLKLTIPGMVPSMPGVKQMQINQMDGLGDFTMFVKALG